MVRKTAEERKEEIVRTSLALMAEVGPDRLTTGMIAAQIGLTQPAVFRHFPSKQDIYLGIVAWLRNQLLEVVWKDLDGLALAQLRMLVERHLRLISANPAIPSLLFSREIMVLNPYVRDELRDLTVAYQQRIEELIKQGGKDGSLYGALEEQQFSFMLLTLLPGLSIHWILRDRSFDLVAEGLRLFDNLHPLLTANAEKLIEAKMNSTDEEEQCNIENKT